MPPSQPNLNVKFIRTKFKRRGLLGSTVTPPPSHGLPEFQSEQDWWNVPIKWESSYGRQPEDGENPAMFVSQAHFWLTETVKSEGSANPNPSGTRQGWIAVNAVSRVASEHSCVF